RASVFFFSSRRRHTSFSRDWSSDVCSSDLAPCPAGEAPGLAIDGAKGLPAIEAFILARLFMFQQVYLHKATRSAEWMIRTILGQIGRASCRERAEMSGVVVSLRKNSEGKDG